MYFKYDEKEINYLKSRDKKLAKVIEKVGFIKRKVDKDLFSSVVHHIIGQQISSKAQKTIWDRMENNLKKVNAEYIIKAGVDKIQSLSMTKRKAEYIIEFSENVINKKINLSKIKKMSDEDAIKKGLMILYKKNSMDKALFEKYRKKFSPYCSIASLYLWAIAGGVLIKMND